MDTHCCPECNGLGVIYTNDPMGLGGYERDDCPNCDGTGWLDEHGEPIQLEQGEPREQQDALPKSL